MEEKALLFVEIAGGIIVGFMLWSFISPMLASGTVQPSA